PSKRVDRSPFHAAETEFVSAWDEIRVVLVLGELLAPVDELLQQTRPFGPTLQGAAENVLAAPPQDVAERVVAQHGPRDLTITFGVRGDPDRGHAVVALEQCLSVGREEVDVRTDLRPDHPAPLELGLR